MFIFERHRARVGEGQRQKETQNLKQARGSELSAQSPTRGSNPPTVRSWPELKSDAQPTEPPRCPETRSFLDWAFMCGALIKCSVPHVSVKFQVGNYTGVCTLCKVELYTWFLMHTRKCRKPSRKAWVKLKRLNKGLQLRVSHKNDIARLGFWYP